MKDDILLPPPFSYEYKLKEIMKIEKIVIEPTFQSVAF